MGHKNFAAAAVFTSSLLTAGWVNAQVCVDDSDCAPEEYCDTAPSSGDSSGPSSDADCPPEVDCEVEPPPVEEPSPPREGQCEVGGRECTSDSECLDGHYCAFAETELSCAEGEDCGRSVEAEVGRCEHEPYTCQVNADCPEPAVCDDDGECVYQIELCESDAQCGEHYECISARGGRSDESETPPTPGAPKATSGPGVDADPGGDDPGDGDSGDGDSGDGDSGDAEGEAAEREAAAREAEGDPANGSDALDGEAADQAAAAEAEAAQDSQGGIDDGFCFPQLNECGADSDCPSGWVCAPIDEGPDGWDEVERACLPPAIAAVLAGDLNVDDGGGSSEDSATDGEAEESGPDLDEDASEAEQLLGTQGGSEGSAPHGDGGCAASPPTAGASAWSSAFLFLLGLSVVRRRRR